MPENNLHIIDDLYEEIYTILCRPSTFVDIITDYAIFNIEARPAYCDRGRYSVKGFNAGGINDKSHIDQADGFPRYYFDYGVMISEIKSFILFRKLIVTSVKMENR